MEKLYIVRKSKTGSELWLRSWTPYCQIQTEIKVEKTTRSFKVKVKNQSRSVMRLFVTTWTVAYQSPPSMGFSRQENWSGLPFT